ncbi:hypothetical protein B2E57_04885 [Salmonella enterica]|nr:hypothetical protein [Salmonella enterica]
MEIKFPGRKKIDNYIEKTNPEVIQNALHDAQEIMYDAWDADDAINAIQLIKKALRKSPLCADAYSYYSHISGDSPLSKLAYLENAVYVGEKALEAPVSDFKGDCWSIIETRPYMRARACLASCLWDVGYYDKAISHYQEMLELNPNDNQGVRYILSSHYLDLEMINELKVLLASYPDDSSPFFLYTTALLAFRDKSSSADDTAREAISGNHYIPVFLKGRTKLYENNQGYITAGGCDEAIEYVNNNLLAWIRTPGAIGWLADISESTNK